MMHLVMEKILDRIYTEPSVLFLGQDYLSSLTGSNQFYALLCDYFMENKSKIKNYNDLWQKINNGNPLSDEIFREMFQLVTSRMKDQSWLRSILDMKWGVVYTSAVDSCLLNCVGEDFAIETIGKEKGTFKREYINKKMLHGICLYGSIDNSTDYPPYSCDKKNMNILRRTSIAGRIEWIYKEVLSNYGLLVIDGWNPESDWLDYLLEPADRMQLPENSIFLFGYDLEENTDETIADLIDSGILTVFPQTFAKALQEIGFFDENREGNWENVSDSGSTGKNLTIRRKDGKYSFINIPLQIIDTLDEQITLLDDDIGTRIPYLDAETRSEFFTKYLQQSGLPNWPICGEKAGFHFERDIDSVLLEAIKTQINEKPSRRNVIVVEGYSNCGKTSSLTYLALHLRDTHEYPIFYISGKPTQQNFEEKMKTFIKQCFPNNETAIDNIIIFWDGNKDSVSIHDYEHLARILSECNILVIGTLYRAENESGSGEKTHNRGVSYIHLGGQLSVNEENNLQRLLERIDVSLFDRYIEIKSYSRETNLFSVLYRICMNRYSPEWISVRETLQNRFYREVDHTEYQSKEGLLEFKRKQEEKVHEQIVLLGIGAAWQLQLIEYKKKHMTMEEENSETNENILKLEKAASDIRRINEMLALAGQFGVKLPVTLLLRIINAEGPLVSQESMFLTDVMAKDSLIEYQSSSEGYPYVRFRQADEAQQYIKKNFGLKEEVRKEKEINLLCTIIQSCRWNTEESYDIIPLIRCFGTNSSGRIGIRLRRGNFFEYINYLPRIADELTDNADSNPEAILVYAHFLRSKFDYDCKHKLAKNKDDLNRAQRKLMEAIQQPTDSNQQYNRLVVEICSNLNTSMHQSLVYFNEPFSRDVFHSFQKYFKEAILTWREDSHFSTNNLLGKHRTTGVYTKTSHIESKGKHICPTSGPQR